MVRLKRHCPDIIDLIGVAVFAAIILGCGAYLSGCPSGPLSSDARSDLIGQWLHTWDVEVEGFRPVCGHLEEDGTAWAQTHTETIMSSWEACGPECIRVGEEPFLLRVKLERLDGGGWSATSHGMTVGVVTGCPL